MNYESDPLLPTKSEVLPVHEGRMTDVPCYPFSRSARSQNIEGAGGKDFRLPLNDDTKPVPDPCRRPEKTFLHCSSVPCIRKADSLRTSMTGGFFSHATVQTRLRRCRRDLPLVILCQNDFPQLIRTSGTILMNRVCFLNHRVCFRPFIARS